MAAAGEQIYTGPVTHALSDASPSPMAAGVMQAKRKDPASAPQQQRKAPQADAQAGSELRPWEISEEQFQGNHFNPTGNDEVAKYQKLIDEAQTPSAAYKQFLSITGNTDGGMIDEDGQEWNPKNLDMDRFKGKLKNMARMVHDYPELAGQIGNLKKDTTAGSSMAATNTLGGRKKSNISYNASGD